MLEGLHLPPGGFHPTYDSIYLRMQILSSIAFLRSIPFYGVVFCALAYILWMSQIFIIAPWLNNSRLAVSGYLRNRGWRIELTGEL